MMLVMLVAAPLFVVKALPTMVVAMMSLFAMKVVDVMFVWWWQCWVMRVHLAVMTAAMTLFVFRSFAGYRLQVGGLAPQAARYAGFSSRAALWTALLVSGGLAGVAGAFEVTGPIGQLLPSISPGYGFAAIVVAFVGRLNPVGTVLGAIVMSLFYIGGELAQSRLGLPSAITGVFQGMLLFFLLACDTLIEYRLRWRAHH